MGTNYYYTDLNRTHVGKRSAAGRYCYACKKSTCTEGDEAVHTGRATWPDDGTCSHCGRAHRVQGCCSFSWAMKPDFFERLATIVEKCPGAFEDEYGGKFTGADMCEIVEKCPIYFTNHQGMEFS